MRSPEYRRAIAERRRFVPAQPADTGNLTYVFVYPYSPAGPQAKRKGLGAALELSGMSAEEIERQLKEFAALGVELDILPLVQREYE